MLAKTCKHHGQLNQEDIIKSGVSNGKQQYKCKLCMKVLHRKNYEKNKDSILKKAREYKKNTFGWRKKASAYDAKYRAQNPEKRKISDAKYRSKNLQKRRSQQSQRRKKEVEALADSYVKGKICRGTNLVASDIPQSLVEFKRALMKMNIKIRQIKRENKLTLLTEKLEALSENKDD